MIDGFDVVIEFKLLMFSLMWFLFGLLKLGLSLVLNLIVMKWFFMGWEEFMRFKNLLGFFKVLLLWERKKESLLLEEFGFMFWMEKEKCVEKDVVVFEIGL